MEYAGIGAPWRLRGEGESLPRPRIVRPHVKTLPAPRALQWQYSKPLSMMAASVICIDWEEFFARPISDVEGSNRVDETYRLTRMWPDLGNC